MKKFSLKNLVLFIFAFVLCAGFFCNTNLSFNAAVYASTPVSHHRSHVSQTQNILITSIVDGDNGSKIIYLYPHSSNGANSINEFFTFYSTKTSNSGLSSNGAELVYDVGYDGGGPSNAVPYNGELSSIINLSKNIQIALKQGYVEISSSAETTSKAYKSDNADKVTSGLYVYDSNASSQSEGSTFVKKELTSTRNDALEIDAFSFAASELEGLSFDTIEFNFKSTLVNKLLFTNHNYMKIAEPQVVLSTSDFNAPILELEYDSNWAQSRTITVNASDAESGLFKVEYKIGNGEWIELANYDEYKTSDSLTVEMTENEELTVRTTDNVGNVSETSYNEENIDKTAPSLNLEINRADTDMSFDFNVSFSSNHNEFVSPEKYYYTYNINGGADSSKVELSNGINHFDATEVGEYNFTFYAEDEAVNSMIPITKTLIFKKLLEISSVTEKYVYSGLDISLDYSGVTYAGNIFSESELALAGFGLKITQNGETKNLKDVGTYKYEFYCTNEFYVLNKSGDVTIAPYEIVFTINCDNFEYSSYAIFLDYSLDKDVNVIVTYTDALGNIVSEPKAVGEYVVNINYVEDNNYILNETVLLTITKRNLKVTAAGQKITYGEPVNDFTYTVTGTLDGDNLSFDIVCDYLVNAGRYLITFKQKQGLTLDEAKVLENYELNFEEAWLEIEKRTAYVIPNENQSKLYNEEDPIFSYVVSGLINSDTLEGSISREVGEDAGFYQFTLGSLENSNYNLQLIPSSFQITKRVAYIVLNDASKVYGDADPEFSFKFDGSNLLAKDEVVIKNAIIREAGENVGTYKITINKADVKNYVIVMLDAKFKITKRPLNVVANQIIAEYGDNQDLTYECDNLASGDRLSGNLEREEGNELGEYKIFIGSLNSSNYDITFTPATYKIVKKDITIVANNTTKIYGDVDNLEFSVIGTDNSLNITLVREAGENVGTYQISGYIFEDEHYNVKFVSAELTIIPAKISVEIFGTNKVYGENDPKFSYLISGLKNGEELKLNLVRELGESVGTYQISLGENSLSNYEIENVITADLVINKADITLILNDKVVTYSGNANYIDEISSDFRIVYIYSIYGQEIEPANVINAGEYKVIAKFDGNENYNAATSNVATLKINKKLVPVTLKKSAFNYTGEIQMPEFDIAINDYLVVYDSGINNPTEVGEYDFTIVSNDSNYVCNFKGTLTIFEGFISNTTGAQAVADGVGISSFGIRLFEDTTSALRSRFNALRDGRRCISVYGFKNAENYSATGEVFTISIKAVDNDDVKIYAVDKDGKMVAVSYTVVGGCYVVSVNDLSASILVTVADSTIVYAKIISITAILVVCYVITKTVRNQKRNYFYRRNTKVRFSDYNELKENENIIDGFSFEAEIISGEDFINQK